MRYVVIGASGFVGGYTIKALIESMAQKIIESGEIIAIDNRAFDEKILESQSSSSSSFAPPPIRFYQIDITQRCDFDFSKEDIIIHLAARAYAPKPPLKPFGMEELKAYFFAVNVEGTKNIIHKMQENGAKNLIYFSTDMVYGKPQYLPVDTAHPRNPIGYYGLSKKTSEDFIIARRSEGLRASIFRPRIIVGAGRLGILTKLFRLIDLNLPVPLIGNGKNCYQMIGVNDCALAIIAAIKKGIPNDEFNLGSNNPPSIKTLLNALIKRADSKSFLIPTHAPTVQLTLKMLEHLGVPLMYKEQYSIANLHYIVDMAKTREILGFMPTQNDEDIIYEAYRGYRKIRE